MADADAPTAAGDVDENSSSSPICLLRQLLRQNRTLMDRLRPERRRRKREKKEQREREGPSAFSGASLSASEEMLARPSRASPIPGVNTFPLTAEGKASTEGPSSWTVTAARGEAEVCSLAAESEPGCMPAASPGDRVEALEAQLLAERELVQQLRRDKRSLAAQLFMLESQLTLLQEKEAAELRRRSSALAPPARESSTRPATFYFDAPLSSPASPLGGGGNAWATDGGEGHFEALAAYYETQTAVLQGELAQQCAAGGGKAGRQQAWNWNRLLRAAAGHELSLSSLDGPAEVPSLPQEMEEKATATLIAQLLRRQHEDFSRYNRAERGRTSAWGQQSPFCATLGGATAAGEAIAFSYDPEVEDRILVGCVKAGAALDVRTSSLLSAAAAGDDPSLSLDRPVLHTLIAGGCVSAVAAAMRRSTPLRLTDTDDEGRTVLHLLATACPDSMDASHMLQSIVDRVVDPSRTTAVNWGQEDEVKGHNFLDAAAANGRLALFWAKVHTLRYFRDRVEEGFTLRVRVRPEDWRRLSREDQAYFLCIAEEAEAEAAAEAAALSEKMVQIATSQLLRISKEMAFRPRVEDIKAAVMGGARLTAKDPDMPETVCSLLRMVINRLEKNPEKDTLDWGQTDDHGDTCIAYAASCGHLSVWWEIVVQRKRVEYYVRRITAAVPQRIRLTSFVKKTDWEKLSPLECEPHHIQHNNNNNNNTNNNKTKRHVYFPILFIASLRPFFLHSSLFRYQGPAHGTRQLCDSSAIILFVSVVG
eukprot:gene1442-838_t